MANNKESKKFKINEVKKISETHRLKIEDYDRFIREDIYNLIFCSCLGAFSIYEIIKGVKINNPILTAFFGFVASTCTGMMISNTKDIVDINIEKNEFVDRSYNFVRRD